VFFMQYQSVNVFESPTALLINNNENLILSMSSTVSYPRLGIR
jgi:hypothetical protein